MSPPNLDHRAPLHIATIVALLWAAAEARALHEDLPAEGRTITRHLPLHPASWGMMHIPPGSTHHPTLPVVILIGDAGGQDGRPALYTTRLLSAGFAVLEADFSENAVHDGGLREPEVVPLALRLPLALAALRELPQVHPAHVAALGFGEGARAVLAAPRDTLRGLAAAVLVQPGYDVSLATLASRHAPGPGSGPRLLIVHGDLDPIEAEACAALEASLGGATRLVVRGAGFGWDAEPTRERRVMLQDPADPDRHREAYPDPQRASLALDRMLLFLMRRMDEASR